MIILLDTHAFIWWDSEPSRLSPYILSLLQDPTHHVLLSVASVWEIQIKSQLGKLELSLPLAEVIEKQRHTNHIAILPVTLEHVLALQDLPLHHKDPFDRLLIAQAISEEATLVSHDPIFTQYPVQLLA